MSVWAQIYKDSPHSEQVATEHREQSEKMKMGRKDFGSLTIVLVGYLQCLQCLWLTGFVSKDTSANLICHETGK